jgi:hypothetical protein
LTPETEALAELLLKAHTMPKKAAADALHVAAAALAGVQYLLTLNECDRTCGGHAMRGVGLRNCCWNSSQALEAFRHLRLSIA